MYIDKCVNSIKNQSVNEWKCYITDDMSTDDSIPFINHLIESDNRFELISNTKKHYQTGNYWQILQRKEIDDNDICITVDGDDWFFNEFVLERVLDYYSDPNIWMTFGQFMFDDGKKQKVGFTHKPKVFDKARYTGWTSTHLRTFKAFLFRNIEKKDLINPKTNNFWESAGDVVCFSPMLELAGEDRIKYVNDINYVYNIETPLNDYKLNLKLQEHITQEIRKLSQYKRLER
jgi:glycosyltransferase involved in cell wall biosynthesis